MKVAKREPKLILLKWQEKFSHFVKLLHHYVANLVTVLQINPNVETQAWRQ